MEKVIIFVIGKYMNGGVARHSTVIANELAKAGYHITLLATGGIGEEVFFHRENKVELVSLPEYLEQHKDDIEVKRYHNTYERQIRIFKAVRRLTKYCTTIDKNVANKIKKLRKGRDVGVYLLSQPASVLIPFGIAYYDMAFGAKRRKDKLIFAERNASQLEVPIESLYEAGKKLEKADALVFQTQDEMQYYSEFSFKKAVVIRNPISSNLPIPFEGVRRKVIVNFCRISRQKNLELLVDAFEKLHRDYPEYVVEIYGNTVGENEEQQKEELIQYIEEKGLSRAVRVLPPRADVHEVCKDAAMFVSTSYFEGLSNSMIEAMAIGLPCICTDCLGGGAREVICDGHNGLLVPNEDVEVCYLAMKKFVEDQEYAKQCGRYAAEIREELSATKIGQAWKKVIEQVSV